MALRPRPDGNDGLEPELWEINLIDDGTPSLLGYYRVIVHPDNPNWLVEGWLLKEGTDFPLHLDDGDDAIQFSVATDEFTPAPTSFAEFESAVKNKTGWSNPERKGVLTALQPNYPNG